MQKKTWIVGVILLGLANLALATPINIVAAENFYGELAQEIGGKEVKVQSIISNPDADPHLFTTAPSISKALAKAQIIVYNGANYDSWMEQMLKSVQNQKVVVINVAELMKVKNGANPHIWYKLETFPAVAQNLAQQMQQNQQVVQQVAAIRKQFNTVPVTATEPVFGYMADSMGLNMQGLDFQWKIMNDTEPSPQMLAAYEDLITGHKVKVLFYNKQVTEPTTQNILKLAQKNNLPVVGVTETMPAKMQVNQWLSTEIEATRKALQASSK